MPAPPAAALETRLDVFPGAALYPCSDDRPMAENMWQGRAIRAAADDLEAAHPEALVAADVFVYPEEGNPGNRIAPDVLLAFGRPTYSRSSYFVWREGKPPDWVLEVASPSTVGRDLREKRAAYEAMGVPEYWLFDPQGGALLGGEPPLQGLALTPHGYRPLPVRAEGPLRLIRSEVLRLYLRVEGALIRFRRTETGQDILRRREEAARADAAEARAEVAEARAQAAEARVAELRAAFERIG